MWHMVNPHTPKFVLGLPSRFAVPPGRDPSLLSNFFPSISLILKPGVSYDLAPENFLFRVRMRLARPCRERTRGAWPAPEHAQQEQGWIMS